VASYVFSVCLLRRSASDVVEVICSRVRSGDRRLMPPMIDHSTAKRRFDRIERASDLLMAVLALLIVPALILEEHAQSPGVRSFASMLNWVVWLAFCAEYLGKLAFAPSRRKFVRSAWLDLLIIVLSPPFLVPDALQGYGPSAPSVSSGCSDSSGPLPLLPLASRKLAKRSGTADFTMWRSRPS
jgi:hypothetical protein